MRLFVGLVLFVLAACTPKERLTAVQSPAPAPAESAPTGSFAWARSDGQRMAGNAELTGRAQADLAACQAEVPPRAAQGVRGEACMRERGYYIRPVD